MSAIKESKIKKLRAKLRPALDHAKTDADLVGRVSDVLPPPEPTLLPSRDLFPPPEAGDITDPLRVMRLAYMQMVVEKLQAQQTSYTLSFDSQIRELTARRATTLAQLRQELEQAKVQYLDVQREIEQAHGIVLEGYAFNPDTGTLNKVVDPTKRSGDGVKDPAS